MPESQYVSLIARGIPGEKIDSVKRIVGHQGGPSSNVIDESIRRDSDGNYSLQIVTGASYYKRLAEGIDLSGYASDVLSVGSSGVNKDYDIFACG
jgi:hypothetical protein